MSIRHTPRTPDAADRREHAIEVLAPDEVDSHGRRLHRVPMRVLEETDGLDRSLVRSGLVLHHVLQDGSDGATVIFAEVDEAPPPVVDGPGFAPPGSPRTPRR